MIPEIAAAIAHATEANARNVEASAAELGIFHRLYGQISYRGYWLAASEPLFLVDRVKQRLSGGKAAAILYQYRLPFLAIRRTVDRDMRCDQHVWHAPERVVGGQRLGICDIEPGASEMARAQRLDQVGRHHTPTARDIDEVSAALHPREQPGVEHAHRVRCFRRRQDHKIALAQTLRQSVRVARSAIPTGGSVTRGSMPSTRMPRAAHSPDASPPE